VRFLTPNSRIVIQTEDSLSISILKIEKSVIYKGVEYVVNEGFAQILQANIRDAIVTYKSRLTKMGVANVRIEGDYLMADVLGYQKYDFTEDEIYNYLRVDFGFKINYRERVTSNFLRVYKSFNEI